jgi:hypothetical protein
VSAATAPRELDPDSRRRASPARALGGRSATLAGSGWARHVGTRQRARARGAGLCARWPKRRSPPDPERAAAVLPPAGGSARPRQAAGVAGADGDGLERQAAGPRRPARSAEAPSGPAATGSARGGDPHGTSMRACLLHPATRAARPRRRAARTGGMDGTGNLGQRVGATVPPAARGATRARSGHGRAIPSTTWCGGMFGLRAAARRVRWRARRVGWPAGRSSSAAVESRGRVGGSGPPPSPRALRHAPREPRFRVCVYSPAPRIGGRASSPRPSWSHP